MNPTALGGLDFLDLCRVRYMVFWAFQPSHGQLEKARESIEVLFESSTAPLSTLTLALFLARLFSIRFTNLSGQLVNIIRSQIHRHHHGLFGFSDGTAPAVSGVSAASARDARCPIIPHVMHALMQLHPSPPPNNRWANGAHKFICKNGTTQNRPGPAEAAGGVLIATARESTGKILL